MNLLCKIFGHRFIFITAGTYQNKSVTAVVYCRRCDRRMRTESRDGSYILIDTSSL
jgi:hypothetical protein